MDTQGYVLVRQTSTGKIAHTAMASTQISSRSARESHYVKDDFDILFCNLLEMHVDIFTFHISTYHNDIIM